MSRPRCAPHRPRPGDPERTAEQWAALAERVRARAAGAGMGQLIGDRIWATVVDPDTWVPDHAPTGHVTMARALAGLSGRPLEWFPTVGTEFATAVALWQPGLVRRTWSLPLGPWTGYLTGPAPGMPLSSLDCRHLVSAGFPSGMAVEALGHLVDGPAPRDPHLRRMRATACLLAGRGETRVGPGGRIQVLPPGWRKPVVFDAGFLATPDPRLARRLLNTFPWWSWLEDPGTPPGVRTAVVSWLAAVAPVDAAATRILAGSQSLWEGRVYEEVDVVLALRAAGHPAGWAHPRREPGPASFWRAPVLWWRRMLGRLVAHPDRARAVEAIEAAWVRLRAGR